MVVFGRFVDFPADLALPALATAVFSAYYILFDVFSAGLARQRYKVPFPRMDGPAPFHRAQRAQANQVEQMPIFLSLMWASAVCVNGPLAGVVGLVWVALRISYAHTYRKTAKRPTLLTRTLPAYACLYYYVFSLLYGSLHVLCEQAGLGSELVVVGLVGFVVVMLVLGALNAKAMLSGAFDDAPEKK
eukprot:m.227317 g.227317  ORF g.227317 m.227317 type:complete len:188 (+) comp17186_c0_seq1:13-576(+)